MEEEILQTQIMEASSTMVNSKIAGFTLHPKTLFISMTVTL